MMAVFRPPVAALPERLARAREATFPRRNAVGALEKPAKMRSIVESAIECDVSDSASTQFAIPEVVKAALKPSFPYPFGHRHSSLGLEKAVNLPRAAPESGRDPSHPEILVRQVCGDKIDHLGFQIRRGTVTGTRLFECGTDQPGQRLGKNSAGAIVHLASVAKGSGDQIPYRTFDPASAEGA